MARITEYRSVVEGDPQGAVLTFIYTPHPVIGVSPETLSAYIAGNDPATGKPVIKEIIDLLTRPVSPKKPECKSSETARGGRRPALLGPDTAENWQRLFYENGWTDGLPVILPTAARVRKMLQGTGASPDEVVAEVFLQDTYELVKPTVSNIAVIAVMAGAKPEYFP